MENFELVKCLVGNDVTEEDLKYVDCYVNNKMGLFIPSVGPCQYASKSLHMHPSYMFIIAFSIEALTIEPSIQIKENQYFATVLSPDIPHNDDFISHYYCILIDKDYFDAQYKMYTDEKPQFTWKQFAICHDILHALNTFIFEYSKKMKNSDITLEAQVTIIVHWLIRSIMGENYDMRSVSNNYAVARAENYMEMHYSKKITVKYLAEIGNISPSSFNRVFKKETKLTPMEYLMNIRLEKSKKLLIRKQLSITEIAMRCGFNSSSHFSSSFSKLYSITPTEYRNNYVE